MKDRQQNGNFLKIQKFLQKQVIFQWIFAYIGKNGQKLHWRLTVDDLDDYVLEFLKKISYAGSAEKRKCLVWQGMEKLQPVNS